MKTVQADNKPLKLQVWDTVGSERFKSITHSYYRNANGCIAVYDLTSKKSFEFIEEVLESWTEFAPEESKHNVILVGNKLDLAADRVVEHSQAI